MIHCQDSHVITHNTANVSLLHTAVQQSVTPAYRGLVLHPPPLPPLNQGAPTTQVYTYLYILCVNELVLYKHLHNVNVAIGLL